jgi:hypothetical protein
MAVTDQQLAQWERLAKEEAPGLWKHVPDLVAEVRRLQQEV